MCQVFLLVGDGRCEEQHENCARILSIENRHSPQFSGRGAAEPPRSCGHESTEKNCVRSFCWWEVGAARNSTRIARAFFRLKTNIPRNSPDEGRQSRREVVVTNLPRIEERAPTAAVLFYVEQMTNSMGLLLLKFLSVDQIINGDVKVGG